MVESLLNQHELIKRVSRRSSELVGNWNMRQKDVRQLGWPKLRPIGTQKKFSFVKKNLLAYCSNCNDCESIVDDCYCT